MKKYSKVAEQSTGDKQSLVKLDRVYSEVDDPESVPVADENLLKAFSYGKQLVPVAKDHESILKLGEHERQFILLGFADASSIPRANFLGGVDVVVPVKSEQNIRAFTSIVLAMIEKDKVLMA